MKELKPFIESNKPKILEKFLDVGIKEETLDKEIGFLYQLVSNNKTLQKCTPASLANVLYNVALTGLTLNPILARAYVVPYYSEATLKPSYKGLEYLAVKNGVAKGFKSGIIYKGDEYEIKQGLTDELIVKPKFESKEIFLVWAYVFLHNSPPTLEIMTKDDLESIRKLSKSQNIWKSHYGEMARKTVIRRLCKHILNDSSPMQYAGAIKLDNQDYLISYDEAMKLDELMRTSTLQIEEIEAIEAECATMSVTRYRELTKRLKANQKPLGGNKLGVEHLKSISQE